MLELNYFIIFRKSFNEVLVLKTIYKQKIDIFKINNNRYEKLKLNKRYVSHEAHVNDLFNYKILHLIFQTKCWKY